MSVVSGTLNISPPTLSIIWGVTLSFETGTTCTSPSASYVVIENCSNDQYTVQVDITALGTATTVDISDSQAVDSESGVGIGSYIMGPYTEGTSVVISVEDAASSSCTISSSTLTDACPACAADAGTWD